MNPDYERTANLLGALALRVTDYIHDSIEKKVGRVASAPAALIALSRKRDGSIEYLRRVLRLSHPATVRLIDRLVHDGLVRRAPGTDRRTVHPVLTPAGQKIARQVASARAAVLKRFVDRLDSASCAQITRILETLLRAAPADNQDASNLCRLCDLNVCNRGATCPVDEAKGTNRRTD